MIGFLPLQGGSSFTQFLFLHSARYEVDRSRIGRCGCGGLLPQGTSLERAPNVSGDQRFVELLLQKLRALQTQTSSHHRVPRVASFAQAFPARCPIPRVSALSQNLTKPDDIDMVYYIVAHEMAHQWWAHQVIGAGCRGRRCCRRHWRSTRR